MTQPGAAVGGSMAVDLTAKSEFFVLNRGCGLPGRRDFVQQKHEFSQSCPFSSVVSSCGRVRSSRTRLNRAAFPRWRSNVRKCGGRVDSRCSACWNGGQRDAPLALSSFYRRASLTAFSARLWRSSSSTGKLRIDSGNSGS